MSECRECCAALPCSQWPFLPGSLPAPCLSASADPLLSFPPDDVFLPKDLDGAEMDETDREVEYFKR